MPKIKDLVNKHGIHNLVFHVPIVFFCRDTKFDFTVECVIDERRYKAADGYKIGLRSKEYFARKSIFGGIDLIQLYFDSYQSDIEGVIQRLGFENFKVEVVENGGIITGKEYNTVYMITGFNEPKVLEKEETERLINYIAAVNQVA